MLAFTNKIRSINAHIPEKIKIYIDAFLKKKIEYFQKKYNYKIEFFIDNELMVPEYRIILFNKNKKIVNKIENINKIKEQKIFNQKQVSEKPEDENKKKLAKKTKKSVQKKKSSHPRTLWVRRKK